MAHPGIAEIQSAVEKELATTRFVSSSLTPLSGGTANFAFRAVLERPLEVDESLASEASKTSDTSDALAATVVHEVLVKHGKDYVAMNPTFALSTVRCESEDRILRATAASLAPATTPYFTVRVPRPFHYSGPETNIQVQEYLPNAIDLKSYCLRHFGATTPTPDRFRRQCEELGRGLGLWLRSFHEWAASPKQDALRQELTQKTASSQNLKLLINYQWLVDAVDRFPTILGDVKNTLVELKDAAHRELQDMTQVQVIHGDFWTGNVLLPNDAPGEMKFPPVKVFIIDWELCHLGIRPFDVGQIVAELYQLYLFKGIDAGLWIVEGLAGGYGPVDNSFAFRTAIQAGTHIISFGARVPGWGTTEDVERAVSMGKDIIMRAWRRERSWFEEHPLGCLFPPFT